jgi:hypothetical protein
MSLSKEVAVLTYYYYSQQQGAYFQLIKIIQITYSLFLLGCYNDELKYLVNNFN